MGVAARVSALVTCCLLAALAYVNRDHLQSHFQLTVSSRALSEERDAALKTVTLFKNGYSTGGVEVQLSAELLAGKQDEALAAYLSQFIDVEFIREPVATTTTTGSSSGASTATGTDSESESALADRVFNGQGQLLSRYTDIVPGDRLYLVAPGLLFVWPFVKLGHRVAVLPENSPTGKPVIIESFTESPRTFHLHNFFTDEEADRLIERVLEIDDESNKLQQSHVGHQSGRKRKSPHRTSENAFDQVSATAITIRKRVFEVLSLGPYQADMCDGLQLLRYKQKQAYIAHTDYFDKHTTAEWNWDPARGGSNRFATVFLYLSNVTRGGQTVFPKAEMPEGIPESYNHPANVAESQALGQELFEPRSWEAEMVDKCSTKLASYPRKAHAILFYSQKPSGELDPMSLHGGCPVLEGTKWGANLWVWNRRRYGLDNGDSSATKFHVVFQNPSEVELDLYWSSTKMTTIAANGKAQYTTFTGHKWTIKIGDRVVFEFNGSAEDGADQNVIVPLEAITAKDEL